jgi:hypothetical protein
MDPGTPSIDHDVALAAGESDAEVRFFAFMPFGRGVYVSATYALSGGDGLVKTDAAAFASSGDAASDAADVAATATSDAVALALSDIGSAAVAAAFFHATPDDAPFGETDSSGARHGIQRADAVAAAPSGALAAEPATTYAIGASWVDASLGVFHAAGTTTTTPEAEEGSGDCASNNVALASAGASVAAVSSNYGGGSSSSSYGADKAIDGSDSSQWSSDGDGDGASITIALPSATDVVGVGFYSRSMTNSAVIQTYEVRAADGEVLATCELPDATALYACDVVADGAESLTFAAVSTTGGNTGARTIEVYGCASTGDAAASPAPTPNEGEDATPAPTKEGEADGAGRARSFVAAATLALIFGVF